MMRWHGVHAAELHTRAGPASVSVVLAYQSDAGKKAATSEPKVCYRLTNAATRSYEAPSATDEECIALRGHPGGQLGSMAPQRVWQRRLSRAMAAYLAPRTALA